MTLSFKESGEVVARVNGQEPTPVSDVEFVNNRFMGRTRGSIDAPQSNRRPGRYLRRLTLDLTLRGDVLNGALVVSSGGAVSYWLELKKEKSDVGAPAAVGAAASSAQGS